MMKTILATLTHNQLWLVTEYYAPRKLNDEELQVLADFTTGQWLDGTGEGGDRS